MSVENLKEMKNRLGYARKYAFDLFPSDRPAAAKYAEEYRGYLSAVKTERESAQFLFETAKKAGFNILPSAGKTKGKSFIIPYRNKIIAAAKLGKAPLTEGLAVVAAHHDSPRLDLKGNPLYEEQGVALLKTHYFGGLRKHQWVTRPLALHGVVVRADGKVVDLCIGEKDDDPVFTILDLLPHLAHQQQDGKKLSEAIPGEKLNVVVGGEPIGKDGDSDRVRLGVLKILHDTYGMIEEDFVSAELEVVPAGPARFVGIDRAFLGGYGHDDRVCSYAAMRAVIDAGVSEKTQLAVCFDKEEIGSFGNTGAQGRFLHYAVEELIRASGSEPTESAVRKALHNSKMISADVGTGLDPDWQEVHDKRNAARVGCGLVLKKYTGARGKTGASDASAELVGEIRRLFAASDVCWQTAEMGKVDEGGGGTIAKFLAETGAEVLDVGPPVLAMHSPFELLHIADIYHAYKAYKAFFEKI